MFSKRISARDVREARVQSFRRRQIEAIRTTDERRAAPHWEGPRNRLNIAPAIDGRDAARPLGFAVLALTVALVVGAVGGVVVNQIGDTFARVSHAIAIAAAPDALCKIEVTDANGNAYVAGVGTTPDEARRNARYPAAATSYAMRCN